MIIGLDFDNTIVCYDNAFKVMASSHLDLPDHISRNKASIKDYLIKTNRSEEWTLFQGLLYSEGLQYAQAFTGAVDVLQELVDMGCTLIVISHKTKNPIAGPAFDLHKAAKNWIAKFLCSKGLLTGENDIILCPTKELKLREIKLRKCDIFLDDLDEILSHPQFPAATQGVLYNPGMRESSRQFPAVSSWNDFKNFIIERTSN